MQPVNPNPKANTSATRYGSWNVPYSVAKRYGYPMRPTTTYAERLERRIAELELELANLKARLP